MTTKQTQRVLKWGAVSVLGLALWVLGWGVLSPARVAEPTAKPGGTTRTNAADPADASTRGPTLQQLHGLGALDLRRPLRDPPPVVVTPPPLSARLLGTVQDAADPGQSMAYFRLSDGTERWVKPGQRFEDPAGTVTVDAVGNQQATVTYRETQHELTASTP
ncbi:MAG: hypothetical protein ACE37H_06140 [Phycisphaeraceae bacterium]